MNVICVKSNSVGVDSWRCISLDMLQPGQLMVHFVLMSNTLLFYVFKLFCWFRYILKHYKIVAKYLFIFKSSQWPLLQCLGDLFDLVTSPGMTEYHSSGCPHVKDMMWHTEHGVATRPLSTFKQLLALTEKCIFRGEKETYRDWINHNWLYGILMVPDNSVYVSWTNPRPGLQNRFSDFVKNCDFICSNIYTCPI